VVCGAVSGNLEKIDFDRGELFGLWRELVEAQAPGLVARLSVVQTPREPPGYHVGYRCREVQIPGNTKLAMEPGTNPKTGKPTGVTLIETRGEGGYILTPGGAPEAHPTGRPYVHLSGPPPDEPPDVTAAERDILIASARSFDRATGAKVNKKAAADNTGATDSSLRPGDDYNLRGPAWSEILTPHGWKLLSTRPDGADCWQRPGKDGPGLSATTGYCKGADGADLLAVFSSNADPFPGPTGTSPCSCHSKFDAYTRLNHGGDYKAAAKALTAEGYGERHHRPPGGPPGGPDTPDTSDTSGDKFHLPAVEPFPTEVFPERLQRYVREGSRAFGSPPDFLGNAMIAVAAAAAGTRWEVVVKETFATVPGIYAANVGPPGSAKSPALERVLRPVRERQDELIRAFHEERRAFEEEVEGYKAAQKESRRKAGGDGSAAAETTLELYDRPVEPTLPRVYTNDCTVEALAEIMRENPRGVGLFRDELVAWTRSLDMYRRGKGTDRQFFLSAWNASPYSADRKSDRARGPIFVPNTFLCVVGGLTPDMLGEFADEQGRDDGFLDRILFSFPDAQGLAPWTEDTISAEAEAAWRRTLTFLWGGQQERRGSRAAARSSVGLTPSAKRLFVETYDRLGREASADDFPAHLRGTWSKLRVYLARLSLLLHLMRFALGEARTDEMVDEASVQGAVALVEYYASHAQRVHALLTAKPKSSPTDAALARLIVQVVNEAGGRWQGTARALLADLCARCSEEESDSPDWPGSEDSVGRAVRRLAGHLKDAQGIEYVPGVRAKDKTRARLIVLRKVSEASEVSATSATPSGVMPFGADTSPGQVSAGPVGVQPGPAPLDTWKKCPHRKTLSSKGLQGNRTLWTHRTLLRKHRPMRRAGRYDRRRDPRPVPTARRHPVSGRGRPALPLSTGGFDPRLAPRSCHPPPGTHGAAGRPAGGARASVRGDHRPAARPPALPPGRARPPLRGPAGGLLPMVLVGGRAVAVRQPAPAAARGDARPGEARPREGRRQGEGPPGGPGARERILVSRNVTGRAVSAAPSGSGPDVLRNRGTN
jgi:hypothetical protein